MRKVVCSQAPEIAGNKPITRGMKPADLADVDYGVVRASFGVAETGSVCLTDADLGVNTLGYLPQHLIVLLDPADMVINMHHAYRRPEWRQARYAVFHTGPSATADLQVPALTPGTYGPTPTTERRSSRLITGRLLFTAVRALLNDRSSAPTATASIVPA